ncbi:MAG: adenylate/guanylate cyclase domain-containing protein [Candidatus Sericytochromatia bacterium]
MKHVFLIDSVEKEIRQGSSVLGRSSDNAISISEASVSSKHLLISNFSDYIEILDLNSSNGTFINGTKLNPFIPQKVKNGDNITLGRYTISYKANNDVSTSSKPVVPPPMINQSIRKDVTVMAKFDPKEFMNLINESKTETEMQKASKRLTFLYSFGQKIGKIIELKDLFAFVIKEVSTLFPEADRALIFDVYGTDYKPTFFLKNGIDTPIEESKYSKSIVEMAIEEKHGFIASDLKSGQDIDTSKSILALNLQCTMIVPFIVDNEIFGLLQLDSTKKISAFNQEDLTMLSGISNQIAVNIKNKMLIEEMNRQEKVKSSLERYLGPKMVTHLIDNKINLDQKGEERFGTVLFSDIRGFTSLSEKLEPKQIIEILTLYFSKMTEIIFRYDGFIDKFIGDAIFCIFGIPLYQDDHADRAVKTAIEMKKELEILNKTIVRDFGIEIKIGIGINTGKFVYGNIASMDRPEVTILGDTVNTAERLCSSARKSEIFISTECKNNLQNQYIIQDQGLFSLKGKEEKVNIYSIE